MRTLVVGLRFSKRCVPLVALMHETEGEKLSDSRERQCAKPAHVCLSALLFMPCQFATSRRHLPLSIAGTRWFLGVGVCDNSSTGETFD